MFAVMGLIVFLPLLIILAILIFLTDSWPVFYNQKRVGKDGKLFFIYKFRTMYVKNSNRSTVTVLGDDRITPIGSFLRRYKLDEIPQLWNVLSGDMSFVGPRPDVPGFADKLEGDERSMLSIRPGITGPATLKYRDEEESLVKQDDPESYNREIIWPDKVRINLVYIRNWSLIRDLKYIFQTVF
ncbi:MAG: sugar transferase [Desulfuromusa sp.]|nr:sugar transferase [Desulfuromusa sp.]